MKIIAKKPCSFGGRKFFIGDEIPAELVTDVKVQEMYGRISIIGADGGEPDAQNIVLYTQEQLDSMVTEAIAEAEKKHAEEMEILEQEISELSQAESAVPLETVVIPVGGAADGDNGQFTAVPATAEEIQQVFSIMQLNAEEGSKAIADVRSENVLILLHAADSRKTVKEAAKKRAGSLFPDSDVSDESGSGNGTTDTGREGDDA